ncbi:PAS domain-containing protein [Candidatus Xianfuyuplasma coldseepsis]|uniref:DUF438 domain-containing protein n=1 Tax=Candidatus Xianfuyuplasma coldseepsis TaxID=2782163 RepID=A0A7L7KPB7_9MOLU|nr:PAS domain-containing protein [Xianfuyuplasma coldseepsis]QMS84385.1 DUF438 domain-containing protein [Xianfuyuplasma coldseepsis]
MELLKNQEKIIAIHNFMMELEDRNHSLTKPEIYRKYESVLSEITPIDIFFLPMYQNNTSFSIDDIKETAGKFVNVFYHGLEQHQPSSYDSNLLIYLLRENDAIEKHLNKIKPYFKRSEILEHKEEILTTIEQCMQFERKFLKREMILFSVLEHHLPTTKPLEVLWSLHDDARSTLKLLLQELRQQQPDITSLIFLIGDYYNLIYGINTKEKLILFPVANQVLSTEEKQNIFEESKEYGYVFIDDIPKPSSDTNNDVILDGFIKTSTGELSIQEFDGIMRYIPIDITFVDKDDKVRYFNNRKERHFPRNPSIIGRLVKHCHPPKSVHIVEQIVTAFKKGDKDIAEFWITFNNMFLYITYYAVRLKKGEYLGTLEVSQDVTRIRTLEGQQRLLDWA